MKPRKRSKPRVWRVWVEWLTTRPQHMGRVFPATCPVCKRAVERKRSSVLLCEIREVPKRRKARRKK